MPSPVFDEPAVFERLDRGALLLTPNHSIGVEVLEAYGAYLQQSQAKSVVRSPRVFAVDIWIKGQWLALRDQGAEGISQALELEPVQEFLIWKQIVEGSEKGAGLLNPGSAAREALRAHRLQQQFMLPLTDLDAYAARSFPTLERDDDLEVFLHWQDFYQRFCRDRNVISLSAMVMEFIAHEEAHSCLHEALIVLLGFDSPPPLYQKLFTLLERHIPLERQHFKVHKPRVQKRGYPGKTAEITAAALWAKDLLDSDPHARVGLVGNGVHGDADDIKRIFHNVLREDLLLNPSEKKDKGVFSCSAAKNLVDLPIVAAALELLALNKTQLKTLECCALLRSPFLLAAEAEEEQRIALEIQLRDYSEEILPLAKFRYYCQQEEKNYHCPLLGSALQQVENLRLRNKQPASLVEALSVFEQQLNLLGWPGKRLDDEARSQVKAWEHLLEVFQGCEMLPEQRSLLDYLRLLEQMLENTPLHDFNPQARIRVLSPLEAQGLVFTHLWVMGLNDQSWPAASKSSAFIPIELQKKYAFPGVSPERQVEDARQQLHALRANCSEQLILSYALMDEDIALSPSAFLEEFPGNLAVLQEDEGAVGSIHPLFAGLRKTASLEQLEEPGFLDFNRQEAPGGGTALIADQASCPFKSFARHRLQARPLNKPDYGLPAFELGRMLHHALEFFWREVKSRDALKALSESRLEGLLQKVCDEACQATARRFPQTMSARFMAMESTRLKHLLKNWMAEEIKRGHFKIAALEYATEWHYSDLSLNIRIDRIDELEDGRAVIVDYKSSLNNRVNWLDARQENPQLLLYAMSCEEQGTYSNVAGLLYAQVNINDLRYRGIAEGEGVYPKLDDPAKLMAGEEAWAALKTHWQSSLAELADEFLQGYCAVRPKNRGSCQYCHLGAFCRINEAGRELRS